MYVLELCLPNRFEIHFEIWNAQQNTKIQRKIWYYLGKKK